MESHIAILQDLKRTNERWNATSVIIEDYNIALQRSLDLEIRISQLQKENRELVDENATKDATLASLNTELEETKNQLSIVCQEKESLNSGLIRKLNSHKEDASTFKNELEIIRIELEAVKAERFILDEELTNEKAASVLIASELQGSKSELDIALQKVATLEMENRDFTNRLKDSQKPLLDKLEEIGKLEEIVQAKCSEVDRIRSQLDLEREVNSASSGGFSFRRRQNPYARRLHGIASILEKGESNKALQALESLVVELQAKGSQLSLPDVIVPDDDQLGNLDQYKYNQLTIPKRPYLTHASHQGGCTSCSASSSGHLVATAGVDNRVIVLNPSKAYIQSTLEGLNGTLYDISFTCTENQILGACGNKSIVVWNTSRKNEYYVMTGHNRGVNCVVADPTDQYKAVSSGEDRHIRFWDLKRGFQLVDRKIALEEHTNAVCFTANGSIAAGGNKGGLRLWDSHSSELYMEYEGLHKDMVVALYPLPTSSNFLLSAGKDNFLKLFDFRNQQVIKSFSCAGHVLATVGYMGKGKCCLGISRDGRFVTAGTTSGNVLVWKAADSSAGVVYPEVLRTEHHQEPVMATAWCNETIVSCDKAGKIVVWY
eukprot:g1258.t1